MTREDRWIVSLDEIRAIRWECARCHAAITFALDQTINLTGNCPGCGADGLDVNYQPDHRTFTNFIAALKGLIAYQRQQQPPGRPLPGTIKLEFMTDSATRD